MKRPLPILAAFLAFGLISQQCQNGPGGRAADLTIVSGSENRDLDPLVQQFARENKVSISMKYLGSVDIAQEISKGTAGGYDAVWPAASIWIAVGDEQNVCKHSQSIMRSPVVFGVRQSVAKELGWTDAAQASKIGVSDILEATQQRSLRFAMTSATQSNSGASWFLGNLAAFAETAEPLQSADLQKPAVRERTKQFLAEVDRSSGSSGWLMDFYLENADDYDGMVNYEVLLLQTNRQLVAEGKEPLHLIYPRDGLTIADSPLAYVNKGDAEKEALFLDLQQFLLSNSSQKEISRLGRRTGSLAASTTSGDSALFKTEYGVDLDTILSPVPMPSGKVIREALALYQTELRKPSLTAFVVDYSGSMEGDGESQLEAALKTLLDQELASKYLLQAASEDKTFIIPFSKVPRDTLESQGNTPEQLLALYQQLATNEPSGGTDLYAATWRAHRTLLPHVESGQYHPAIIVMSDGKSDGTLSGLKSAIGAEPQIPIFTILFGDADPDQMKALADWGTGRMFDGRKDVIAAFRKAKGYN